MVDDAFLEAQAQYYRDRAPEYDDWWYRRGAFDGGPEHNARWFEEAERIRTELIRVCPGGRMLELAAGTGTWTRHLVQLTDDLTVVDSSAETLELNRIQVGDARVRYELTDLYGYRPDAPFEFIFFGFWISHVPAERFDRFFEQLKQWLTPGGKLFFLDGYYSANAESRADEFLLHEDEIQQRELADGRSYEIVKRYYNPGPLAAKLATLGFDARVEHTGKFFIYGHASLAR